MHSSKNISLRNIYWDNGRLKRSIQFLGDLRSGMDRMWNEEGILLDEGEYKSGKPVGKHRRWNEKGQLIEEIIHKDEKRFDFRLWDEEGKLLAEAVWIDDLHYRKKAWDGSQNQWIEKTGIWNGREIHYETDFLSEVLAPVVISDAEGDFSSSYTLLMERFPKIGFLISGRIPKPTLSECIQDCRVGKAELIYVYGIGNGAPYFQLKDWLLQDPKRKLIFLEDDLDCLAFFLQQLGSSEVLSDPKVHIEFLGKNFHELEAIADKFPLQRVEVFAIPSKKSRRFESIKLQIFRKTTLSHAIHLDRIYGYHPFENFVKNTFHMPKSFYANAMKDAFRGIPAIICGAGPSLDQAIPLLKTLSDRAILIAGGSTLAALSAKGVPIHFGMAVDPNLEEYRRLKNSFALETPILYSTRVHPSLFQTCNGPFGYMRSGIGGILEIWMEEALGFLDPIIGQKLSSESISVTTICTAWAEFIGCNAILFCGVDLAYSEKRRYAEGVALNEDLSFASIDAEKTVADRILKKKDTMGRPVYTATRWVMEAASLSDFAKKHKKISFFNTSEMGLKISGVPFLKLSDAIETHLQRRIDIASMIREKIASCPMPKDTCQKIDENLLELNKSLHRVVENLEVITKKKPGSGALAEIELSEELASDLIFYDMLHRLGKRNEEEERSSKEDIWERFLVIARKYQQILEARCRSILSTYTRPD